MEHNINEVKRTQGQWYANGWHIQTKEWHIAEINPYAPEMINSEENIRFICKAVNSYDSLIEENKMLLEVLKNVILKKEDDTVDTADYLLNLNASIDKAKEAINKAENK